MKKTVLKSLYTLCAGVMTLCATSSLFVSCESYDDTLLKSDIQNLKDDVASLDVRITRLSEDLNGKIQVLASNMNGELATLSAIKFRIHENKLEYSFDESTWTTTAVDLSQYVNTPCPAPEVKLEGKDGDPTVTITVGDTSFEVLVPGAIDFEIEAGKVNVKYEETLNVFIKSKGLQDISVISVPKGWWAEINNNGILEVTAPAQADVDSETAAAKGFVKLHACSVEGNCMVGKFPVEVSANPAVIKVGGSNYEVSATYPLMTYFSVVAKADFTEEMAQQFLTNIDEDETDDYGMAFRQPVSGSVQSLYGATPLVPGEEYVLFACVTNPYAQESVVYTLDDIVKVYYTHVNVNATAAAENVTPFDIKVDVAVDGAEKFYVYALPYEDAAINEAKESMAKNLVGSSATGTLENAQTFSGNISALAKSGTKIVPGMKLALLVMPVIEGRDAYKYTAGDVSVFDFTTTAILPEGSVGASATKGTASNVFSQLVVDVATNPADAEYAYYMSAWFTEEEHDAFGDDVAGAVAAVFAKAAPKSKEQFKSTESIDKLEYNSSRYLVAFFVDNTNKYGQIVNEKFTVETFEYANITLALDPAITATMSIDLPELTFSLNATGETASQYKYLITSNSTMLRRFPSDADARYAYTDDQAREEIIKMAEGVTGNGTCGVIKASDIVDGKVTISGIKSGAKNALVILPYGERGNEAKVPYRSVSFTPSLSKVETENLKAEPTVTYHEPYIGKPENTANVAYCYKASDTKYNYYLNYNVSYQEGTEVRVRMVNYTKDIEGNSGRKDNPAAIAQWIWTDTNSGVFPTADTQPNTPVLGKRVGFTYVAAEQYDFRAIAVWKHDGKLYYKEFPFTNEYKAVYEQLKDREVGK